MIIVRTNDHFQAGAREQVLEQGVKRDDDTKLMCPYLLPLFSDTHNSLSLSLVIIYHTIPCHVRRPLYDYVYDYGHVSR
jgi:hypothetical protein